VGKPNMTKSKLILLISDVQSENLEANYGSNNHNKSRNQSTTETIVIKCKYLKGMVGKDKEIKQKVGLGEALSIQFIRT
jgi:hypothetical protein